MLKKKIIANSIVNLTDARYFAGWMVDAFVFSINPNSENYLSPQEIGTFQSWVEGPKFYLEYSEEMNEDIVKHLVDLNCQGIYIPYASRELVGGIDAPIIFSLEENELEDFLEHNSGETAVLHTSKLLSDYDQESIQKNSNEVYYNIVNQDLKSGEIENSAFDGYMVHGSPEEKVGFKSYDELDEIFEELQDF